MERKGFFIRLRSRMQIVFRTKILPGVVILVPVVVTFRVLRLVFRWLDGLCPAHNQAGISKRDGHPWPRDRAHADRDLADRAVG